MTEIIVPLDNEAEWLFDLPAEATDGLTVHFLPDFPAVFRALLAPMEQALPMPFDAPIVPLGSPTRVPLEPEGQTHQSQNKGPSAS